VTRNPAQFHDVLRNANVIPLLLQCIAGARHTNTVIYSCQTLMNLVEFHEPSQAVLQETRHARVLREVLLKAGKGHEDHDIKKHVRLLMHKSKVKERAGCSML
jgi:hypothetical protein